MKKELKDVLLEKEGRRLIVKDGKQKYYNDQMKNFPIDQLAGQKATIVKIHNNLIQEVHLSTEEIFPAPKKVETMSDRNLNNVSNTEVAKAPYNFVPLQKNQKEKVVKVNGHTAFSKFENERFSGFVKLSFEAKTPLFIKGHDNEFFRTSQTPFLPGSSLRGLTRNIVSIISYGAFDQYDERKLMYRRATMLLDNSDFLAGILYREGEQFHIIEADAEKIRRHSDSDFHYSRIREGVWEFTVGIIGRNPATKWKISKKNNEQKIQLNKEILEAYIKDEERTAPNLLECLKRKSIGDNNCPIPKNEGVPVFFKMDDNNSVTSIGSCKYHRVQYKSNIDAAIPDVLKDGENDFCNAIFGNTQQSGRVFFEDAVLVSREEYALPEAKYPKILASPKPTCFQHYLEQPSLGTTWKQQIKWDENEKSKLRIRGHKLYWHRQTPSDNSKYSWVETGGITTSHTDPINPIAIGATFQGRIRFENLTKEELGALLFALDLPEGCCHKLGMGKPLGLGSVKITPTLTLIDRKSRYEKVFDENGNWFTAEREETNLQQFKYAFAKFIGEQTQPSLVTNAQSYWENDDRMRELKHLLTFEPIARKDEWHEETRYMEITHAEKGNEYKSRPVLPRPSEVVSKLNNR